MKKVVRSWRMDEGPESAGRRALTARPIAVSVPPHPLFTTRLTKRMQAIDPALLALARGDGPVPSSDLLVPVDGDDDWIQVRDSWLELAEEPAPFSLAPPGTLVPPR